MLHLYLIFTFVIKKIPNGEAAANVVKTDQAATANRNCGRFFSPAAGATASVSVCSKISFDK